MRLRARVLTRFLHTPHTCVVRVQVIDTSNMRERARRAALQEVEVLRKLRHPNIIGYHGSFIEGIYLCIVLEYADGGDLAQAIRRARHKRRHFAEKRIMSWLCQITSALNERAVVSNDVGVPQLAQHFHLLQRGSTRTLA
ncbi:hypothetical protein EON67_11145, partial [archaeon]